MLTEVAEFHSDMHAYDYNMRSGSFLDTDTKLHDKYLANNDTMPADYKKLVDLNGQLKH